jgi:hypothetical protein
MAALPGTIGIPLSRFSHFSYTFLKPENFSKIYRFKRKRIVRDQDKKTQRFLPG